MTHEELAKKLRLNSKWSYMVSGMNITFAFVGALFHSLLLLLMGIFFGAWNYFVAEHNREVELNEQVRKADSTDDETQG